MPIQNKIKSNVTTNLYPDIELPKWMTSEEKAVILFDDL